MQKVADVLKGRGNFRWVGLYAVDRVEGMVNNLVWSGPGAPAFPSFPLAQGLTAAAIASQTTVNANDVAGDPRYLTTFGSTRSEIIVPVFDERGEFVVGTIDIESEEPYFFDQRVQDILEACALAARSLWQV